MVKFSVYLNRLLFVMFCMFFFCFFFFFFLFCFVLFSSVDFVFKSTFSKLFFRNATGVSNSLDPDQDRHLSGLIWVQTVCKGYQQTTKSPLAGKELKDRTKVKIISRISNKTSSKLHVAFYKNQHWTIIDPTEFL